MAATRGGRRSFEAHPGALGGGAEPGARAGRGGGAGGSPELEAQGIEREAGQHRGPAISGIEARGQQAEVSARRAAERALRQEGVRQPEHQELVTELREVTREEVAARAAARERREFCRKPMGSCERI